MKLESIALHHGYESEKTTKAATTPIYQTTSFTFDDTKHGADLFDLKVEGNIYTRIMNPTNGYLSKESLKWKAELLPYLLPLVWLQLLMLFSALQERAIIL